MSEEIFKILLEEFKRNGVKLIEHDFRGDVFISDPADIVHETFKRQCTTIPQLLDFSEHDKVFEDTIAELDRRRKDWIKNTVKLQQENEELKQRIAELESKEVEKPTKNTVIIVAKEINGQEYVGLKDFMSVVNDLQAEIGT